jgi:hypothetical protein
MIKIKLFGYDATITEGKIITDDRITRKLLEPFLTYGLTASPQSGYISYLEEAFGDNVKLITVDDDENTIY